MKLDEVQGLAVTLRSEGRNLAEYEEGLGGEMPPPGSRYVEAIPGATFSVHVKAERWMARYAEDCIVVEVYLDGKFITSRVLSVGNRHYGSRQTMDIDGVETNSANGRYIHPFQFTGLVTNDSPVGTAKKDDYKDLGSVTIKCRWCRQSDSRPATTGLLADVGRSNISEKCLKGRAISSQATLGDAQYRAGTVMSVTCSYPYGRHPFATFTFKYRTHRDLQIEGIIERSPSPVPLEERDPDDLTPEEARELVRRMRERNTEQARVKQEFKQERKRQRSVTITPDEDSGDDDEVTITEATRKRARHSNDSAVDIVDLTDA